MTVRQVIDEIKVLAQAGNPTADFSFDDPLIKAIADQCTVHLLREDISQREDLGRPGVDQMGFYRTLDPILFRRVPVELKMDTTYNQLKGVLPSAPWSLPGLDDGIVSLLTIDSCTRSMMPINRGSHSDAAIEMLVPFGGPIYVQEGQNLYFFNMNFAKKVVVIMAGGEITSEDGTSCYDATYPCPQGFLTSMMEMAKGVLLGSLSLGQDRVTNNRDDLPARQQGQ